MPKNVKVKNVKENIGLFMIQIIQQKKSKIYLFWKISLSAWHPAEIRYDRYSIDLFEEMRTKINICRRGTDRFSSSFQAILKTLVLSPVFCLFRFFCWSRRTQPVRLTCGCCTRYVRSSHQGHGGQILEPTFKSKVSETLAVTIKKQSF